MNPYLKDLHFKLSRCGGQHQTSRNCLGFMGFWVTPGRRASKELVVGDHCNHLMTAEVWTEIHIYRGRYQSWRQPPKLGQFCKVWNYYKVETSDTFEDETSQRNCWMIQDLFLFERDSRESSQYQTSSPHRGLNYGSCHVVIISAGNCLNREWYQEKNTWISNKQKDYNPCPGKHLPIWYIYIYIYKQVINWPSLPPTTEVHLILRTGRYFFSCARILLKAVVIGHVVVSLDQRLGYIFVIL